MSDHVPPVPPPPRYGEYAPPGYVHPSAPPTSAPVYVAYTGPKRRTWDVVLTVILLVMGFFGMLTGVLYGAGLPAILQAAYTQYDAGTYAGGSLALPSTILVVSHLLLYLAAGVLSIPLLIRGRIVVFWIPLVAGFVAAIVFWSTLFSVIASDSTLMSAITSGQ